MHFPLKTDYEIYWKLVIFIADNKKKGKYMIFLWDQWEIAFTWICEIKKICR